MHLLNGVGGGGQTPEINPLAKAAAALFIGCSFCRRNKMHITYAVCTLMSQLWSVDAVVETVHPWSVRGFNRVYDCIHSLFVVLIRRWLTLSAANGSCRCRLTSGT